MEEAPNTILPYILLTLSHHTNNTGGYIEEAPNTILPYILLTLSHHTNNTGGDMERRPIQYCHAYC